MHGRILYDFLQKKVGPGFSKKSRMVTGRTGRTDECIETIRFEMEGAQSVPDLEKMIRLSRLFGVSTDYLLKDEIEETGEILTDMEETSVRNVSMEEANAFLSVKAETSKTIRGLLFLCILFTGVPPSIRSCQ